MSYANPATNVLGTGVTEDKVLSALSRSGYPLQMIVANKLRSEFSIQEEWNYVDSQDDQFRAIDLLAEKRLFPMEEVNLHRIRPKLDLIIECKRSNLPYVFFLLPTRPWLLRFPLLAGQPSDEIEIVTDDDLSTYSYQILDALGLTLHPFVTGPVYSATFARADWKGSSELEISGNDSFHGLVLPLLKALNHFKKVEETKGAWYFDCHLTLGLGVLDAPIVGVTMNEQGPEISMQPWVRIIRYEADETADMFEKTKLFVLDIVHKDFLTSYVTDHVTPFANEFSTLARRHSKEIVSGKGFVAGMKTFRGNIEQVLRPRRPRDSSRRGLAITRYLRRLRSHKNEYS